MIVRYGGIVALVLIATTLPAAAQGVIRDGVTYLEAEKVVLSIVPDSLDGVHLFAEPRRGEKESPQKSSLRFDPAELLAWLQRAEEITLDSTLIMPNGRELQSPMLSDLDGAAGLLVGRLWQEKDSSSSVYWTFQQLDDKRPLLIKADVAFSQRLAAALRMAAKRSNVDSVAFASGLVAPISGVVADSLGPKPLYTPAPSLPSGLLSKGTQGIVEVRYVIDTTGRVDMTSFEVIGATHAALVASVKRALARGRFRPARHQGVKARRRVWQRIRFSAG
jgi:hypothetical protein